MFILKKTMWISGSHELNLDYDSRCENLHGHNWKIIVECRSDKLNKNGMVVDFTTIKKIVNQLDHEHINQIITDNPTAENIAKWLYEKIPHCHKVTVQETEGNEVIYVI